MRIAAALKDWIVDRPGSVIALVLLMTLGFAIPATRIEIDPSVEGMILDDDPNLLFYRNFVERFGSDELVVIGLHAPRLFEPERLETVRRISDALARIQLENGASEPIPLIDRVISLSTATRIGSSLDPDGEAVLEVSPFLEHLPASAAEVEKLWSRATGDPLYVGNFVSRPTSADPDAPMTTLILARIVDRPDDLAYRTVVRDRIQEILDAEVQRSPELEGAFRLAGVPILKAAIGAETEQQSARAQIVIWALIIAVLIGTFGFRLPVLFVIAAILCAVVWTLGFVSANGGRINVMSAVILPLVRLIGVSTAIHILIRYYLEARESREPREIVARTLEKSTLPCFLATLTTSIGFLSLMTSQIKTIRDLGLHAAFGVMAVWLIANTLIPALLVKLPAPPLERRMRIDSPRVDRLLDAWSARVIRMRVPILVIALLCAGVVAYGISRMRVETDLLEYFPPQHRLQQAYRAIETEIGAIHPIDVTLRAAPGHALDPEFLARAEALQSWLDAQPEVERVLSVIDYLRRLNREFHGGDPAFDRVPDSQEQIASLLMLYDSGATADRLGPFVHPNWEDPETLRIAVRMSAIDTEGILGLVARIERHLASDLGTRAELSPPTPAESLQPGDAASRVTGVTTLFARMATSVVNGQLSSLLTAVVSIWLTIVIATRSPRIGTLAMLPNLLPTLAVLALMGFFGISLNIGTAMIAAITLGISDDDTIHFMSCYQRSTTEGSDPESAVRSAMRESGRPMVTTALILALGFLASGMISTFEPLRHFNLLAATAMLLAVAADLTLTPALLLTFDRRPTKLLPLARA